MKKGPHWDKSTRTHQEVARTVRAPNHRTNPSQITRTHQKVSGTVRAPILHTKPSQIKGGRNQSKTNLIIAHFVNVKLPKRGGVRGPLSRNIQNEKVYRDHRSFCRREGVRDPVTILSRNVQNGTKTHQRVSGTA